MTAAAAAEIASCLNADHHQRLSVNNESAAPTKIAATPVAITEARIAAVPDVTSQGISGMRAPTANVANEEVAA